MTMEPGNNGGGKMEGRLIAFLTAVALAFGGIWLQNQYDTTLQIQRQQTEFMRHVDEKYVSKEIMTIFLNRFDRLEEKIDNLNVKDGEPPRSGR